jgi:hypothetical protein
LRSVKWGPLRDDPDFERKAADIIALYLHPQHAAVICVDEKTAIQALDRLDPVLPLSPGRAERHGFDRLGGRPMKRRPLQVRRVAVRHHQHNTYGGLGRLAPRLKKRLGVNGVELFVDGGTAQI